MLPNPEQAVTIYTLPDKIRNEIDAYSRSGVIPSEFIAQILCNNLVTTMLSMKEKQAKYLEEILTYINNELNPNCWGSASNVRAWVQWKKEGESKPLQIYQLQEGLDAQIQIRALGQALTFSDTVVEFILTKSEGAKNDKNLQLIHQKAVFALKGEFENSLAVKIL